MKQRYKYISSILIVSVLLVCPSCTEILDKQPLNVLTENLILSDKDAFTSHMAYLYSQMPFEGFAQNAVWLDNYTDEIAGGGASYNFGSWGSSYVLLRALNTLIEKLPSSAVFPIENDKNQALGELKFMRALVYFSLVQRYGGVPLVTKADALPEDPKTLYKARDKAADIYKFIETEMDEAIALMQPGTLYRLNKWSGIAYKSRAMLYAADIAKYHEIQLDGVIGIPASEANHYFQSARDAAKLLIESGPYELYNVYADKVTNYHKLFFDETASNKERIFVEPFLYPIKGHRFDLLAAPFSQRGGQGYGGGFTPTLEMVEDYEYTNDPNGALIRTNPDGTPKEYTNPADLFKDKEPRFLSCVIGPGSPWRGQIIEIYGNVITGDVEIGGTGKDGLSQIESSQTGFYNTKFTEPAQTRPITTDSNDNDKMLIRYAEVLLTYAEAQLELGNEPEARIYINMIRTRAGLQALTGPVTMDNLKHERKIELAYEGQRYWDLMRWRIYHILMYNKDTYGLWPVLNKDKTPNVYTFRTRKLPADKFTRNFDAKMYYNAIGNVLKSSNPLLVENPGW